jgi:hypothetical protein
LRLLLDVLVGLLAIEVVVEVPVDSVDGESVFFIGMMGKGWAFCGGVWCFAGFDADLESETGTAPGVVVCFPIPAIEMCLVGFASSDV